MQCPFANNSKCLQDEKSTKQCQGEHAQCPKLGIKMRRPEEIEKEIEALGEIPAYDSQPDLIKVAFKWILYQTAPGVSRPSKWFK